MKYPLLCIDAGSVQHNARRVREILEPLGVKITGVTKGVLAHPIVVGAMLSGGIASLGDSRLDNLRRIRSLGFLGETVLLRAPSLSACKDAVEICDISLNSSLETVRALGREALKAGKIHKVILMVDLGDLREGVLPESALDVGFNMGSCEGIFLHGVGANFGCYAGVIPTREKLEALVCIKYSLENSLGRPIPCVSGGNSANMSMVLEGKLPRGVNNLRIGEAVLLGTESVKRAPVKGCVQDTFKIMAEVIEVFEKPTKPEGEVGQNAFGEYQSFKDMGVRKKAVCALGRQDVVPLGLKPLLEGAFVSGASSDHLLVDVENVKEEIKVGAILEFRPNYAAMLQAFTSPFVEKAVL